MDRFGTYEGPPLSLGLEEIRRVLPHREPMLLLDRVIWLEPGRLGAAVGSAAPIETAARSGRLQLARLLPLEGIAQLGAVVVTVEAQRVGICPPDVPQPGVLAAVSAVDLAPEDGHLAAELTYSVEVERRRGRIVILRGEAHAHGRRVARGQLSIVLGFDRLTPPSGTGAT